jgi:hypothetical protein
MLLALLSALASARPDACHWNGEARDPFTGRDGRWLEARMMLEPGASALAGINVHHAVESGVQIDIGFDETGSTERRVDATLQFLLGDGSVAGVHLVEPAPPTSHVGVGLVTPVLYTSHLASGMLPLADAQRIAATERVTQLRHDLLSTGTVTRKVDGLQSTQLIRMITCAIGT